MWKKTIMSKINSYGTGTTIINEAGNTIFYSDNIKKNRDIKVITGNEELVRAFLINKLVKELGYKSEILELEKEYKNKVMGRKKQKDDIARIDLLVKDSSNNPFYFIEIKDPNKFENDKDEIEGQLFNLAEEEVKKYKTKVNYLVYYTAELKEGEIVDKVIIIDYSKYKTYNDWVEAGCPEVASELSPGYNKPKKQPLIKGDKKHDLMREINKKMLNTLSSNLHNVLWGGGGTTDTEIFFSLVNIILAKIQDESERRNGEEYKFQIQAYGDEIENPSLVFERVNELYRKALEQKMSIKDPEVINKAFVIHEQKFPLNKLIYTVEVLEKISFLEGRNSADGTDILGEFFENIIRDGFKQTKGQFFTPTNIVKFILYALELDKVSIDRLNKDLELPYIIDPSCGSGNFLIEAMKCLTKEVKYKQNHKLDTSMQVEDRFDDLFKPDRKENKWAKEYLYGVEINFDLGTASKVNMIMHGDGVTNIFVKSGLLPFRVYDKKLKLHNNDSKYLDKDINGQFDILISNPPFSANIDSDTKKYLSLGYCFGNKKNSENLFIERYYQLLKENGRLGIVLPESIFDTQENTYIRLFMYKYFKIKAVVSVPQLTFEPYTSTKTSILFAQKKTKEEIKKWNDLWNEHGKKWSSCKTRVENYIKVYINGDDINKYPSIKNQSEDEMKEVIREFVYMVYNAADDILTIEDLLVKYREHISQILQYDKDLVNLFGYYNYWWVMGKVSAEDDINSDIFMAEAQNVGYKRTKRGEKETENDLYDIEVAPSNINRLEIDNKYEQQMVEINVLTEELEKEKKTIEAKNESKLTKRDSKKLEDIGKNIEYKQQELDNITDEKNMIDDIIDMYYEKNGSIWSLREEYHDREDEGLINAFTQEALKPYFSNDVLIRRNSTIKILDYIRKQVDWDESI